MSGKSFFSISNLGGGGSDKYRENVYLDLLGEQPILVNYYYIRKQKFAGKWLRRMDSYDSFNNFYKFIQDDMTNTEKYIQEDYVPYETYSNRVFLLDSGVRNFINDFITSNDEFNFDELLEFLSAITEDYLEFAERMKFELVVGLDVGGKYTFKDGEIRNEKIIKANEILKDKTEELNKFLALETVTYMKVKNEYNIKVLGTVHGKNPVEMKEYMDYLLGIESSSGYSFFGYAIGGIASSKQLSLENQLRWGINSKNISELASNEYGRLNKRSISNIILVSKATKIIRNMTDKWIHCLGAGAYVNILPMLLAGADSFDSQSPGRRAYDGNTSSSDNFDTVTSSISKILSTKVNMEGEIISGVFQKYYRLNEIVNQVDNCNCLVCQKYTIEEIKELYKSKSKSNENYYLARQLMNIHSIHQHQGIVNMYEKHIDNIYDYLCNENEEEYSEFLRNLMEII